MMKYNRPLLLVLTGMISCGHAWSAIAGRWHSLGPIVAMLAIYVVAVIVSVFLVVGAVSSKRRHVNVWSLVAFCTLFAGAIFISNELAKSYRSAEISKAIMNGLVEDCETVFASFRDHPQLEKDGYVRLFPGAREYEALPNSIRGFDPVYVTIEQNPFGIEQPLNIGLCKNGFGGFRMGVRIFQNDPNIPESLNRTRIAPTIYLWVDET